MANFTSLTDLLDAWFETNLNDLPEQLRVRVKKDLMPLPWDNLSPQQRRQAALQWDYQHDPDMEDDREYWWNLAVRISEIQDEIDEWKLKATPTAKDLELQKSNIEKLEKELATIERQFEHADRKDTSLVAPKYPPNEYISAPTALNHLQQRCQATMGELAAWVWQGSENNGLTAFIYKGETSELKRFYYNFSIGQDYLAPLMRCWFLKDEIENFEPKDRYVSGKELIEEWGSLLGSETEAFIRAKIQEDRLTDIHPTFGKTQGSKPEDEISPSLEDALFLQTEKEKIDLHDLCYRYSTDSKEANHHTIQPEIGSQEWRSQNASNAANARHDRPGGSREKQRQIREIWATGKYTSRDRCAEEECAALDMSYSAARKALKNTPDP